MTRFINKGFTLFELIISLLILGLISVVGISSYKALIANQALTSRIDQIYYTLQFAKSEAIKRNKKIYVQFCNQQQSWKIGISESSHCDCFTQGSCQLSGIEKIQDAADGQILLIDDEAITFTSNQTSYDTMRFSVETGSLTLKNSEGNSLSIIQSAMRMRVCSKEKAQLGYPKC